MSEHYFSEAPSGDFRPREIEVILTGAPRSVQTAGGVFSPEHLDRGTEILLRTLERIDDARPGPVLDLGCGWGPIALAAALSDPDREVWAVDVNERSRELTRANAARLGLDAVHVAAPEDVPAELRFGEIHSNPPIRVGKEVLHGMLQLWLPRLAPGGAAHLVVAKHLGADSLQRWIATEFTDLAVERVARDKGFHIIRAERAA
ncbi:methyltransferase [Leucobacter chromiireducens]|uniref:Methyltransferase domain-containing protein n=1 Tax=Leucobacter chromiireducens subsp. chromiireducens TaxID=660067 RepID=A0ABS1SP67_9MICO|nr:methyltransferase domain-containing protein [Leucobacter chromiireducens subsp. chromiireducens]